MAADYLDVSFLQDCEFGRKGEIKSISASVGRDLVKQGLAQDVTFGKRYPS